MANQEALDDYIGLISLIRDRLHRLTEAAEDHFDVLPDHVHWGHVGNLEKIASLLIQTTDFAFQEGENAPD